jgi:hypothetical protein
MPSMVCSIPYVRACHKIVAMTSALKLATHEKSVSVPLYLGPALQKVILVYDHFYVYRDAYGLLAGALGRGFRPGLARPTDEVV